MHERVMGRVLRLDRVAKDRPGEPVRPIEVAVRKLHERGGPIGAGAADRGLTLPQLDHIRRTVHVIQTREDTETFTRTDPSLRSADRPPP